MIAITPEMIGPGIDEEYEDALARIKRMEAALKGIAPSNDTREGRMVYQVMWLRQEIMARRLPIPVDRKYWGTLGYLVAEGSLDYLGIEKAMGELATILGGRGLLKRRHYPVVVAMIDDLLELTKLAPQLDAEEQQLIDELRAMQTAIRSGEPLPLQKSTYPIWNAFKSARNLEQLPEFLQQRISLGPCLFDEWRPGPCLKGPLPAPNPGMVWGQP
jgi:hypothetical protein